MSQKDTSTFVAGLELDDRVVVCEYLESTGSTLADLTQESICLLLTKNFFECYEIPHKQKGNSFSLSKKIRFCINPVRNVEIWMSYGPTDIYHINSDLYKELTLTAKARIEQEFYGYEAELESLLSSNPLYLNADGLSESFEKIKNQLESERWLKEARINPLDFPLLGDLARELIVYAGPTNSGKTYHALNHFKEAKTGVYVGPLRLNALEVFEDLNKNGIPCNLLTGEEKTFVDGAMHTASTIELMDFKSIVDVVLVDEAQFIDNEERGHSFFDAIAGARAKKIIATCPAYAVPKLEKMASLLNIPIKVRRLERKTKLGVTDASLASYKDVCDGMAIVSFTKRRLLELKKLIPKGIKVSVIYGSLPPEVKRNQAKRFRDGVSKVVLATDCIGIGLNLPIKHIVFDAIEKFDGVTKRRLEQHEALQIAGRAGRYGLYEEGFVSGVSEKDHLFLKSAIGASDKTEMLEKFYIRVPFDLVDAYVLLTNKTLPEATKIVYENARYDKDKFQLSDFSVLVENLRFIERVIPDADSYVKWKSAHIPIEIDDCEDVFRECLYVLGGLSSTVELDVSVLRSGKPYESLYEGYQKLLADIDCITWFISTMEIQLHNIAIEDIKSIRSSLISKINSTLVLK